MKKHTSYLGAGVLFFAAAVATVAQTNESRPILLPPGGERAERIQADVRRGAPHESKIDPLLRIAPTGRRLAGTTGDRIRLLVTSDDTAATGEAVRGFGGSVIGISREIQVVSISVGEIDRLARVPSARSLYYGGEQTGAKLDAGRAAIGADPVHAGVGLDQPYTGQGVIVGVFDSGVDEDHPDFRDAFGNTRILYLWDMSDDGAPPVGYDWGTEYTSADIDAGRCMQVDGNGHGTHVTSTAAGNGRGSGGHFVGIAPEADIIMVHGTRSPDGNGGFASADIVAGCRYIFEKADALDRPAVINLSLGGHAGAHDGSSAYERALESMVGPGRIIVAAAGNDGAGFVHATGRITPGTGEDLPLQLSQSPMLGTLIYYEGEGLTATVVAHDPTTYEPLAVLTPYVFPGSKVDSVVLSVAGFPLGRVTIDATTTKDPESGLGVIGVVIDNANGALDLSQVIWSVFLTGNARYDAWALIGGAKFAESNLGVPGVRAGDNDISMGIPATARKVIAVASFVSKNGWFDLLGNTTPQVSLCDGVSIPLLASASCFSAQGPTRDGRNKPEITAPGEAIFAARSGDKAIGLEAGDWSPSDVPFGFDGYVKLQGTSMAAPHVAGAIALLLEKNPRLDYDGVMQLLATTALHPYPGFVPNTKWGYGMLNLLGAMQLLAPSSVEREAAASRGIALSPNPARFSSTLDYTIERSGQVRIAVTDIEGKESIVLHDGYHAAGQFRVPLMVKGLPVGVYVVAIEEEGGVRREKLVIER